MLILFINCIIKIIGTHPFSTNDPISYNTNINLLSDTPPTDTPVCINPCLIRKSILHAISLGASIIATITNKNPRESTFQKTDILEVLHPHELNGLLYSYQPSRKTQEYISKNNSFLVIKLGIEEPIRSRLIIPKTYVFQPLTSIDTKTTSKYVDTMLVYKINKPSSSNNNYGNIIYVENQPIFTISSKTDTEHKEKTTVNISECDNAAENVKNIRFIYAKKRSHGGYRYIEITYTKNFCGCQYLIEECLIEDVLHKVDKINCRNKKYIIKGLNGAKEVLINQTIRCKIAKCANSCIVKPGCHCKNKCETQTNPIEKICPITPIEYMKYCWQATVNCFITSHCAIQYSCDIIPLNKETCYATNNASQRSQCAIQYSGDIAPLNKGSCHAYTTNGTSEGPHYVSISTLQQLLSKIYSCKTIFEVRACISLYLSTYSSSSIPILPSCISECGISSLLELNDCRYDVLRAHMETDNMQPNIPMTMNMESNEGVKKGEDTVGKGDTEDTKNADTEEDKKDAEIEEDTKDADTEEDTDNESDSSDKEEKKKSSNVWIWVTVSITAVLIVGVGSYFLFA